MSNPHDRMVDNGPYNHHANPSNHHANPSNRLGTERTALIIHGLADVAAIFLGLWILLYMLDANEANVFVDFVHGVADWLAGWSQDIFTMEPEGARVFLNYALPALIYLGIGHGVAAWVRRL